MLAQVLVDVLTVAVLHRLGRLVAGERVGWVAGLLYALNPSSLRFVNELLTEILFGLLLTTAVWMFARTLRGGRTSDALRCGSLFGLAILCKPNLQFLPLALVAMLVHGYTSKRRHYEEHTGHTWWHTMAAVAGAIVIVVLPWVVRNRVVFGEWFYTRTFDDNLAHVSAVSTLAHSRGESVAPWSPRWEALYDEIIVRTASRYGWETVDDAQLSARERDMRLQQLTDVAGEIVREHPIDFVLAHTKAWLWSFVPQEHKFWTVWLTGAPWPVELDVRRRIGQSSAGCGPGRGGDGVRILVVERLLRLPPLALTMWVTWGLGTMIAAVLFVVGAIRLRPRLLSAFMVVTIFYVTFVPGPISQIRFRLPVVPLILLLVAVGLVGQRARPASGEA